MNDERRERPAWAEWQPSRPYTLGAEEEVMLLNPRDWSLAQQSERVFAALPGELEGHLTGETQSSVVELSTGINDDIASLGTELFNLRSALEIELSTLGIRAASAGTHPSTVWQETVISRQPRYQAVYGSMRELARREPTFALHIHVGVADPEDAIRLANAIRAHVPMLLALSVNSPFWQGRDTGLASARTPLFQAFPRVGIPRAFESFDDWRDTVELLVRCEAFPEPTFLWWDVRPQPRFGTVEVRICDAQTQVAETAALCALVQCIARLEIEDGFADQTLVDSWEVLCENRFLAARDGIDAELIDPRSEQRVPVRRQLAELLEACIPHALALGCGAELERVRGFAERTGAERQIELARRPERLPGLVATLADDFCAAPPGSPPSASDDADQARSEPNSRASRAA
ncbi:MAG: carboxylate-amine ligase [Solirubrobacterales bacterium]